MSDDKFILKGDPSVYWVLTFICSCMLALGYYFDTAFLKGTLYAVGGLSMTATLTDWLFYNKTLIRLDSGELDIYRGLTRKRETLSLSMIREALVLREKEDPSINFKHFDFNSPEQVAMIKTLKLVTQNNKEIQLNKYEYNAEQFLGFLKKLQQEFMEVNASNEERIEAIQHKCNHYIQQDKQLIQELNESLHEAYRSVYRSYILQVTHPADKEKLKADDISFYYPADPHFYYYYRYQDYKNDIERESIDIAENLVVTARQNLIVAQTRLEYYKQIQAKLLKIREKQAQRAHLKSVADRLDHLQKRNMQKDPLKEDLNIDSEVLIQLDLLTRQISYSDNLARSEVLKQHAAVFKQYLEEDNRMLRELNEKLNAPEI